MSGSVNKVILIGNLGKDPENRNMQGDKKIVTLSLATTNSWKDKATGAKKELVEWHKIIIFNEALANIAMLYLKKGSKVYLEGQLQSRKWTDKDGVEHTSTEVVLSNFSGQLVLLSKDASHVGGNDFSIKQQKLPMSIEEIDELPF